MPATLDSLAQCAIAGRKLEDCLVIDVHGHIGHPGFFDGPVTDAAGVVAIMDRIGVRTLCASHLLAIWGDVHRGNDLMAQVAREYPGRFFGYGVVNPNRPPEVIKQEMERCRTELGLRGIKTHTSFHDYPADGPAYWPVYEYAQKHGLPLLAHSLGPPGSVEKIARGFPGVTFIIAHAGGGFHGRYAYDVVPLAAKFANVYLDLASSMTFCGGLEALVREVGTEKILFGSDVCFQQVTHQIGTVLLPDLPERQKRMILGQNAAKIFGIGA
jgi:predicted TIM-barrel fold metal-dependent hydrolase